MDKSIASQLGHYCEEHQSRFFKNEKIDQNGQPRIWYSHKKADGTGFCVEIVKQSTPRALALVNPQTKGIFMCNAMNNAIALACNQKIALDQIGDYYQKILSNLIQTA